MKFRDYYKVLGVSKSATADEIKKAFRKAARKHHPDVNPGDHSAEKRFKEINEAHEVLGDPDKRRKYDELGANWRQYEQAQEAGADPFSGGGPVGFGGPGGGQWHVNVGGNPGGFHTMSEDEVQEMFGENPFSDFFQTFFGGGGGPGVAGRRRRAPRRTRGRDVEHRLDLSLEQAFHGVTQRLLLKTSGRAHTVEVRIPAGVTDGSRVRVAGEGEPGTGAAAGDLYLRVRLKPHVRFECKKRDLYITAAVPVTTAVLGGDVEVPTLDGKSLRLRVPERTQPAQVFRLKGKGMPRVRGSGRGDLYATVQITLPVKLSAETRKHYEALAALEEKTAHEAKRSIV